VKDRHLAAIVFALAVGVSCRQPIVEDETPSSELEQEQIDAFGPSPVRARRLLLGLGSGAKDWDRDGTADGIEALVRLVDDSGAPTKRAGALLFEMYSYDFDVLRHRGRRLARWRVSASDALDLWEDGIHSGYRVKLKWPSGPPEGRLVLLDVTFRDVGGDELRLVGLPIRLPE